MGGDPKVSVYTESAPLCAGRFTFHFLDIEDQSALDAVFAEN